MGLASRSQQQPVGHVKKSKFYFKGNGEPLKVLEHNSNQMLLFFTQMIQ